MRACPPGPAPTSVTTTRSASSWAAIQAAWRRARPGAACWALKTISRTTPESARCAGSIEEYPLASSARYPKATLGVADEIRHEHNHYLPHEATGASRVRPSLVTRAAIHLTRSAVVMFGGMSMTRCPTVAHVDRTTRSAAGCRSKTLDRYGSPT